MHESDRGEFFEEILSINGQKPENFEEIFKDSHKYLLFFVDGAKNLNEFPVFPQQNSAVFEDFAAKTSNDSKKSRDFATNAKKTKDFFEERDILKAQVAELLRKNQLLQQEINKISAFSNDFANNLEEIAQITPKPMKIAQKPKEIQHFYTPKANNRKNPGLEKKNSNKTAKIQNNQEISCESDEEFLIEEDPRPFPGKIAIKKLSTFNN